jgi:type IV pilus assembly protein PilB
MPNVMENILIKQMLSHGIINEVDIELLDKQSNNYLTIPLALVSEDIVTSEQLANFCCTVFDVSIFNIIAFNITAFEFTGGQCQHQTLLDEYSNFIRDNQVLPVMQKGELVTLATAEPYNYAVQTSFEFNTGLHVEFVFCEPILLQQTILQLLPLNQPNSKHGYSNQGSVDKNDSSPSHLKSSDNLDLELEQTPESVNSSAELVITTSASFDQQDDLIISYVDKILKLAIEQDASDLHFEPYENNYRIRFRVDGVLINKGSPPDNLHSRLAARVKVMADMDIAEKRKPQDGRLKLDLDHNKHVEFRVSTLPTIWGEKVVLRILDTNGYMADVTQLGFEQIQQQSYIKALSQPQGLILVTGPTGSGKTLTLYSGLNFLNTEDKNISTIEDPVEYHLQGINQVQVNHKAQLDFASSLRAFLRQDPDVVMVGEIRDLETAQIAIKASHTGHLVLSTIHTNSAAETLNRLNNMGLLSYNLASAISLIIAQRLVRCLCEHCKQPEINIPKSELIKQGFETEVVSSLKLYKPIGCRRCNQGYKGRTSIFELLKPNEQIRQIIMQGANALDIQKAAVTAGMMSLREAGLSKVLQGVTSLEEVNRVVIH